MPCQSRSSARLEVSFPNNLQSMGKISPSTPPESTSPHSLCGQDYMQMRCLLLPHPTYCRLCHCNSTFSMAGLFLLHHAVSYHRCRFDFTSSMAYLLPGCELGLDDCGHCFSCPCQGDCWSQYVASCDQPSQPLHELQACLWLP